MRDSSWQDIVPRLFAFWEMTSLLGELARGQMVPGARAQRLLLVHSSACPCLRSLYRVPLACMAYRRCTLACAPPVIASRCSCCFLSMIHIALYCCATRVCRAPLRRVRARKPTCALSPRGSSTAKISKESSRWTLLRPSWTARHWLLNPRLLPLPADGRMARSATPWPPADQCSP